MKPLATTKGVKPFLGNTNYHSKFIWNYAQLVSPLTHYKPILTSTKFKFSFDVHTDASSVSLGAFLALPKENGPMDLLVFFTIHQLNLAERNYTTIE